MKYHQEHPVRIRKEKGTKITVKKKKKTERKKNPLSFSQKIGYPLNALPTYKLESIIEQCQQIIKDRE